MSKSSDQLPRRLLRQLNQWGEIWGVPDIADVVEISFSERLSRTFARCRPLRAKIVVRADLAQAPYRLLAEVVCHELAHFATYQCHGAKAKPHGKEWQALIRKAGFEPRIRIHGPISRGKATNRHVSRVLFEHRCPVCQTVRVARRTVVSWRCAQCLDAGLDGVMVITPRPSLQGNLHGH